MLQEFGNVFKIRIPSFLCRVQTVSVKGSFQYNGNFLYRPSYSLFWNEIHGFDRPPFVVKFSSTETGIRRETLFFHWKCRFSTIIEN